MRIVRHLESIPAALKGAVIAIGNFDGVHAGHRALIEEGRKIAKAKGRPFALLTFEPHPRRVFQPEAPPLRLMRFSEKALALGSLGVDAIFAQRFTRSFSNLTADTFITKILAGDLGASDIVTGTEFVFGKGRAGNAATMQQYANKGLFGYTPYIPVQASEEKISSTRIRAHLAAGECEAAAKLLTGPFCISGHVIHGDKRGRVLGFPTANLSLHNRFLPKFGVYAVRVRTGSEEGYYHGVANLGIRPMYKTKAPLLEVHLFDFSEDIYGRRLCVELLHYLRDEQKFTSESDLIAAMKQDEKQAKALLDKQ